MSGDGFQNGSNMSVDESQEGSNTSVTATRIAILFPESPCMLQCDKKTGRLKLFFLRKFNSDKLFQINKNHAFAFPLIYYCGLRSVPV
jgi:hypothetical protein